MLIKYKIYKVISLKRTTGHISWKQCLLNMNMNLTWTAIVFCAFVPFSLILKAARRVSSKSALEKTSVATQLPFPGFIELSFTLQPETVKFYMEFVRKDGASYTVGKANINPDMFSFSFLSHWNIMPVFYIIDLFSFSLFLCCILMVTDIVFTLGFFLEKNTF